MSEPVHSLYRFFDKDGRLLYIGRTIDARSRWRSHERTKDWFPTVATLTREAFPTAAALAEAETRAILCENPLHNIVHNQAHQGTLQLWEPVVPVAPAVQPRPEDPDESVERRWEAAGVEPVTDCEGDETFCECAGCHSKRLGQFEHLRSAYGFHPRALAATEGVERDYFAGAWLVDWYYDLFDLDWAAPMGLAADSKVAPTPAFVEFDGGVGVVDCPFCLCTHRHLFTNGADLDAPLESPCRYPGRYVLYADYCELLDAQYAWGDRTEARAA